MTRLLALLSLLLLLVGCGSVVKTPPAATSAQGVYTGTANSGSTQFSFYAIIKPDDTFTAVYGTLDTTKNPNEVTIYGMVNGQGQSNNNGGFASSTLNDYYYNGYFYPATMSANYISGKSIQGNFVESAQTVSFSGQVPNIGFFNFNSPAKLGDIAGTWNGGAERTELANSITINADGTFTGSFNVAASGNITAESCNYSGKFTPNSTYNYFDLSMTYAAGTHTPDDCQWVGAHVTGTAVVTHPAGKSQLMFSTVQDNNGPLANAFMALK